MMKNNEKSYEFFLSELFTGDEPELGYIIELMRAAGHIEEIQKILLITSPPDSMDEDETIKYEVELESLRIFLFNISAAQLREVLLLFHNFRKLSFYAELKNDFSEKQKITAKVLEDYVNEYDDKKGLLYNILRPLRNKVFHYDQIEALEWGKSAIENEKDEKPRSHYISKEKFVFGPGLEYDSDLFSKYLFWGEHGVESLMKAQIEIWQIHQHFLNFVGAMSEVLMKRAKIPSNRPFDWIMKYRYGYKRGIAVSRNTRDIGTYKKMSRIDTQYQIKNVTQWLALPEIEIQRLKNPNEKGKVYDVKNVGFFMANIKQCSALNIIEKGKLDGKIPLPSIVMLFEGHNKQFRLPIELNDWVYSCVSLSASGMNPFPSKVEIGNLSGNIYAEIL